MIQMFKIVTLYCDSRRRTWAIIRGLFGPKDEGTVILRNVRNCWSNDTASHPTAVFHTSRNKMKGKIYETLYSSRLADST